MNEDEMPAENRKSDCSSLNWEEFFVSSNTEDLLPCLLGMYDSIAAARKLRTDDDEIEAKDEGDGDGDENVEFVDDVIVENEVANRPAADDHVIDNETDSRGPKMAFVVDNSDGNGRQSATASECSSANAPPAAESPWCRFRDVSSTETCPNSSGRSSRGHLRPGSPASLTSMSSRYSVCSHGSSSDDSIDDADNESNRRCIDDGANLADESADSLVLEDSNRAKNAKPSTVQPRTSYTTASQYSEDSGIYSNLVRSESMHERSWCCSDGEDFTYTNRVILEILETELVYVNDLHQIITGYLDEWRNDRNCALSHEQIHDLFNNIEEIYNFNRCFLWELEQCGLDPVKIARCFVENNANFSIYAAYCTNYPRSISILTELMRQEKTAHLFRERQIRLHHTLPLGSYLLKPVQRILKYHLLLQNMVKHTPADAVGYNDITVALSTMTGIAHHINTMKRRHEHAVRVQEVQSLLTGWQGPDLTTFGELYAEGSFRISGAKAFRHIFLFEHMLLVTKKKEAGILNYKTHILCSNLMLVECIPKEPLSFQIIPFDNPRLQFSIHARSLEEKRHWTLELKRVILENYNVNIPSHARQLVMELGQIQRSDNVSVEKMSSPRRQLSTPEYLERRKLDREKKVSMKSRLLPLFRKLDSLQNHKMRSKLKKNQFLSEGSIFSDTSINSDESYTVDTGLQNLSKTTEDLSQTCDEMTRTLADLSKSSICSSIVSSTTSTTNFTSQFDTSVNIVDENQKQQQRNSYQQKEKLIEEIIGQLLIASQKFQKAIKEHEMSVRSKQQQQQQQQLQHHRLSGSDSELQIDCQQVVDHNFDNTDDELVASHTNVSAIDPLKYAKDAATAFSIPAIAAAKELSSSPVLNTSSESLSASLCVLVPTPPTVWLKQQAQHLVAPPHKKADSLPRTFQVSTSAEDEWRANRPKTIASDKPTQMKDGASGALKCYGNDQTACCDDIRTNSFLPLRKRNEVTLSIASSLNATTTVAAAIMVHPECKFYRTSVARMTLKRMMRTLSTKLTSRRGKGERFYKVAQEASHTGGKYNLRRENYDLMAEEPTAVRKISCASDTSCLSSAVCVSGGATASLSAATTVDVVGGTKHVVYRQGSSDLGARIANGKEVSDYADPKVLFPTITPSKKAAALLGIRAYSSVSPLHSDVGITSVATIRNGDVAPSCRTLVAMSSEGCETRPESDCSADSFYERQFEEVECEFENAIRETSILKDAGADVADEAIDVDKVRQLFRRYSQVNVNISVHRLIKIPPPVPVPVLTTSSSATTTTTTTTIGTSAKKQSAAVFGAAKKQTTTTARRSKRTFVMASTESSIPTRGWVKQVVEKFQSTDGADQL